MENSMRICTINIEYGKHEHKEKIWRGGAGEKKTKKKEKEEDKRVLYIMGGSDR